MDEGDTETKKTASLSTAFHGAEEFLVGLSPGYWSHVPLCIADVTNMKMMAGVNCIVRESLGTLDSDNESISFQFFPVSKCTLVGMVVFAEAKANNSFFYVLDDGTGFIDCLAWGQGEDSIYALPVLGEVTHHDGTKVDISGDGSHAEHFVVGDLVRVMGRIECVSVSDTKQQVPLYQTSTNSTGTKWIEMRDCIHEIHVNVMTKLSDRGKNNDELNWEANHWAKTMAATRVNPDPNSRQGGLRHATHVLEWMGPRIRTDIENRRNFPSADDTMGEWRVFGVSCRCTLPYKEDLLYCHCQATVELLDPSFIYRDAMLCLLVEMERSHHKKCLEDLELPLKEGKKPLSMDFRFQYSTVSNHGQLHQVAKSMTSSADNPRLLSKRLMVSTFRALRQDGIIHLLDEKTDTYLLISRKSVLDPYLRRYIGRKQRGRRLPTYLRGVPPARIEYLRRCISSNCS